MRINEDFLDSEKVVAQIDKPVTIEKDYSDYTYFCAVYFEKSKSVDKSVYVLKVTKLLENNPYILDFSELKVYVPQYDESRIEFYMDSTFKTATQIIVFFKNLINIFSTHKTILFDVNYQKYNFSADFEFSNNYINDVIFSKSKNITLWRELYLIMQVLLGPNVDAVQKLNVLLPYTHIEINFLSNVLFSLKDLTNMESILDDPGVTVDLTLNSDRLFEYYGYDELMKYRCKPESSTVKYFKMTKTISRINLQKYNKIEKIIYGKLKKYGCIESNFVILYMGARPAYKQSGNETRFDQYLTAISIIAPLSVSWKETLDQITNEGYK